MEEQKQQEEERREEQNEENAEEQSPPLMALNHVSRLCKSVQASIDFYVKVLGFVLMERPQALDFNGAWLFNYGIGIHLVQKEDPDEKPKKKDHLDLMDNHISFQCNDMEAVERKLKEMNIQYMKRSITDENRTAIDQLFFDDPDGYMIEICNCENLKLVSAGSLGRINYPQMAIIPRWNWITTPNKDFLLAIDRA